MISKMFNMDIEEAKQRILDGICGRLGCNSIVMHTLDYPEYPQCDYLCLSFKLDDMIKAIVIEYAAGPIPIPEIISGVAQQFKDQIVEDYFKGSLIPG